MTKQYVIAFGAYPYYDSEKNTRIRAKQLSDETDYVFTVIEVDLHD